MKRTPPLWLIALLLLVAFTAPLLPDGPFSIAALLVYWPIGYWLTKRYSLENND